MNNDYLMAMVGMMAARRVIEEQFTFPAEMSEVEQFEALAEESKKKGRAKRSYDFLSLLSPNRMTRRTVSEF